VGGFEHTYVGRSIGKTAQLT